MINPSYNPKKYKFFKYSKEYPEIYEKEKKKILKAISEEILIEHVGSTSVPGLGGKGVIDIVIKAPKNKVKLFVRKLNKLGYKGSSRHPANDKRIFLQKIISRNGKESRVNVHLALTDEFLDSFIVFRDYLRNHKSDMAKYERIKKEGAKIAQGDGQKYYEHKMNFVRNIATKAFEDNKNKMKAQLYPANEGHFKRLIPFAQRILNLLRENGIRAIVYGSFAHFYYTKDRKMEVHDIDMYVEEKNYPKLIKLLKKEKIKYEYNKKWQTLGIEKGDLRIEVDSIDFWYKDLEGKSLSRKFEKIDFYGIPVEIINLKNLEKLYLIAYSRTTDNHEKIMKKIKHLENFLGRKLR